MPKMWKVICQRCGFERYNHECAMEWTGLFVCKDTCWDARHPQDYVRGVPDDQTVPIARPEAADVFLTDNQVQPEDL